MYKKAITNYDMADFFFFDILEAFFGMQSYLYCMIWNILMGI